MTILDYATNGFGQPIEAEYAEKIAAYLDTPDYPGWSDIHGILLSPSRTLWQAILEIDPTFPRTGRRTTTKGKIVKDWDTIPSPELVKEAIYFATH